MHAQNFSRAKNTEVAYLCDVDSTVLKKAAKGMHGEQPERRKRSMTSVERSTTRAVDAISIATPDHWHAPMAILAMKAGFLSDTALAGLHGEDRHGRVPVIGRRDRHDVDALVVERAPEVVDRLGALALDGIPLSGLREHVRVDVAQVRDFAVLERRKVLRVHHAASVEPEHRDDDSSRSPKQPHAIAGDGSSIVTINPSPVADAVLRNVASIDR